MKRLFIPLGIAVWMLVGAGCAMLSGDRPDPELAAQYIRSAENLENQGDPAAALEQYKLALTAEAGNETARANIERLNQKLTQLADERYQLGMKYHGQGKYGLARNEFLTALKYRPDHPNASKMLVSREPQKAPAYRFHVVKPGESLSMIAKTYYGDYKKFDVIARFNQIEDATKVSPGQRIMIPELDGALPARSASDDYGPATSYVEHVVRPGESISKLAQLYYGNYKQFHIIAQFNGMDDATDVKVGHTIKVPKVAGLPFYEQQGPGHTETAAPASARTEKTAPTPGAALETIPAVPTGEAASEAEEQIMAYRDSGIELFNEGRYDDAIFELNKAIEAAPKDARTRSYLSRAYFESGRQLFDQHDYDAAQEAFESALQYDPQCRECRSFIEKSKTGPLLMHRNNGLDYFKNNQFNLAIQEFEKYLVHEPQDAEIRRYISKSYFQRAMAEYNKGDFLSAKKGFETAASYDATCEQCARYVENSVAGYKETHYNKGIIYFGKEQLREAIGEWEKVHALDPGYKDVEQNLNQAKRLLEKLEQIKKSNQ